MTAPLARRSFITGLISLVAALGGCSEQLHWPKSNAFNVPATYLGCMEIGVAPGESFGNFDIYQPVHFTVEHDAMLHDVYAPSGCVFKETVLVKSGQNHVTMHAIEVGR